MRPHDLTFPHVNTAYLVLRVGQRPHLHRVHHQLRICTPRCIPGGSRVPKVLARRPAAVLPRLVAHAVREVAGHAAHRQVDDDVEHAVEGSGLVGGVLPWVGQPLLGPALRLIPALPHAAVHRQHAVLCRVRVQVRVQSGLVPIQAKHVEVVRKVARLQRAGGVRRGPSVVVIIRTKVKGAAERVDTTGRIGSIVAAGLHHVDLAARRPVSVRLFLRQQPDGGPQPVALWQLRPHFEAAVLEGERLRRPHPCALDWVDVIGAAGRPAAPVEVVGRAHGRRIRSPQVQSGACHADVAHSVGRHRWHDVQVASLREAVASVVGVVLKLPVAAARRGEFVLPL
mmetsp:Transcript_17151/g.55092  ORF Transcript_17151/g.55092 Transcript_17151/m.55092 type:complete len:340 (-) Transcript_17151:142-1161(-)